MTLKVIKQKKMKSNGNLRSEKKVVEVRLKMNKQKKMNSDDD